MSDPTDEKVPLDAITAQYRAELERLNYVRGSINVYLRSIRKLLRLMKEQGVVLGDLTPDVAAIWFVEHHRAATASNMPSSSSSASSNIWRRKLKIPIPKFPNEEQRRQNGEKQFWCALPDVYQQPGEC